MPSIKKGNQYMQVVTYTGNGSTQTIEVGFKPDLVWIKSRSTAYHGALVDSVRGSDKFIYSSLSIAEETQSGQLALTSSGFTLSGSLGNINNNGTTYVAWCWKAGDTTVSNTVGTIASEVNVNIDSGISVVSFTGNGASGATVGHGLGRPPAMFIVKNRDVAATAWPTYHKNGNASPASGGLRLNLTDAFVSYTPYWNNTSPTSSVISLGNDNQANGNTNKMIAYCFAEIDGFSKFGSYTGNGSADGPFVYLGFRPRWLLIRSTTAGRDWLLYDTARLSYNTGTEGPLQPNTNGTPYNNTGYINGVDILSNGFKLRVSTTNLNATNEVMIYAAFAENPFNYSLAR